MASLLGKRSQSDSETTDEPPTKKQKTESEIEKEDIFANIDLDLNIVVGRNRDPVQLNFYSDKMKEIAIDSHINFQFNPNGIGHNILWKNKVVLPKGVFCDYQDLIRTQNKNYCHFHQPSAKQMLQMYQMAPPQLQESESCGTILYNIHKSIMSTTSEDCYRSKDRHLHRKRLTNLDITNFAKQWKWNEDSKKNNDDFLQQKLAKKKKKKKMDIPMEEMNDFIDDYGWKQNVFHKLAREHRISPVLFIRDYLKLNYGVNGDCAKQICVLLSFKKDKKNMNDVKDQIMSMHKVDIPINVLQSVYFGLMTDCIRGYNQNMAWHEWNEKMLNTQNEIVRSVYSRCEGKGAHFLEHTLIGKFRGLIAKINENIDDEKEHIKILNEPEQKQRIFNLKHEQIQFYREMIRVKEGKKKKEDEKELDDKEILKKLGWKHPPTPDLLLNRPIMINGSLINWMDSKNFLITHQDKVKYRKIMQQVEKYTKSFGNGALVCLGYVKTHRRVKHDVMILDASYWKLTY